MKWAVIHSNAKTDSSALQIMAIIKNFAVFFALLKAFHPFLLLITKTTSKHFSVVEFVNYSYTQKSILCVFCLLLCDHSLSHPW